MRARSIAFLVIAGSVAGMACGGGGNIQNLPLRWSGVNPLPRANPSVTRALAASPIALGLRDLRVDPTAVGSYQDTGFVVRTTDNVGQYCTDRLGEMLIHAGAHLEPGAPTTLEAELLEYKVVEGSNFEGTVRVRTTLRRGGGTVWTKVLVGTSKRWGRTHSPENFNEALSNALAEVTQQLLLDDEFARSLGAPPAAGPIHHRGSSRSVGSPGG